MATGTTRIEVRPDTDGGWAVVRDCIVDGHFSDVAAANDYASACARRAHRAGMVVALEPAPADRRSSAA